MERTPFGLRSLPLASVQTCFPSLTIHNTGLWWSVIEIIPNISGNEHAAQRTCHRKGEIKNLFPVSFNRLKSFSSNSPSLVSASQDENGPTSLCSADPVAIGTTPLLYAGNCAYSTISIFFSEIVAYQGCKLQGLYITPIAEPKLSPEIAQS